MFVDYVIRFGEGTLEEWTTYKSIMDLFSNSTSMKISESNSIFLEFAMDDHIIKEFKKLFPFEVKPLNLGFKYLGYYLKPNNYSKDYCMWLVGKVENRITQWCNKWLTLGGRMILVKEVLKNIYV